MEQIIEERAQTILRNALKIGVIGAGTGAAIGAGYGLASHDPQIGDDIARNAALNGIISVGIGGGIGAALLKKKQINRIKKASSLKNDIIGVTRATAVSAPIAALAGAGVGALGF